MPATVGVRDAAPGRVSLDSIPGHGFEKGEVVDFGVKLEHEEGLRDEVGKLRMPRGLQAGPPKVPVNQTALKHEGPCPLYIP